MESGVSIAYISDLERANLKNPSLATLSKIARALDVSVDYLLGDPHHEPRGPAVEMPASLVEFLDGSRFGAAVAEMARTWKLDNAVLTDEWSRILAAIEVAGRQPQTESDWLFVFETIRRAIDR
jgi:transcriptional regulator with XRE-family HTH domain